MTDDELAAELDRRAGELGPFPPDVTQALVGLVFAVGHARLGNAARARALATAGRNLEVRLRPWGHAIPTWTLGALAARVDQALGMAGLANAPLDIALPEALEVMFTYFGGYPVNVAHQLREQLRTLEPVPFHPAVPLPRKVVGKLETVADAEAAIDVLQPRGIVEALTALVAFPEADAMPLVARAAAALRLVRLPQLEARATVLRVAAYFGWGELVQPVLPALLDDLDATHVVSARFAALSTITRSLRQLGAADELRRVIDRVTAGLGGPISSRSTHVAVLEDPLPERTHVEELRFLLAGAAASLDDRKPIEMLASAADLRISDLPASLVLHRRLAIAAAHDDPRRAVRSLRQLVRHTSRLAEQIPRDEPRLPQLLGLVDAHAWAIAMLSIRRG